MDTTKKSTTLSPGELQNSACVVDAKSKRTYWLLMGGVLLFAVADMGVSISQHGGLPGPPGEGGDPQGLEP